MEKEDLRLSIIRAYEEAVAASPESGAPANEFEVCLDVLHDVATDLATMKRFLLVLSDMIKLTVNGQYNENFRASVALRALTPILAMDEGELAEKFKDFKTVVELLDKYKTI